MVKLEKQGKSRLECFRMFSGSYRSTSLTRNRNPLGPYRRPMPRVLWGSGGGGRFLMGEVPLYSLFLAEEDTVWGRTEGRKGKDGENLVTERF